MFLSVFPLLWVMNIYVYVYGLIVFDLIFYMHCNVPLNVPSHVTLFYFVVYLYTSLVYSICLCDMLHNKSLFVGIAVKYVKQVSMAALVKCPNFM